MIAQTDTSLQEVVVNAFQQRVSWKEAAASVAIISNKEINRFSIPSLVPVFNTVSGVRMEERSPGSYRIAIRGNLLRSPFGVRNLKIYWNGLPISDATGNSYFNLLDISQIQNIEITKGPASSMYGAGTSGAILLHQPILFTNQPKQQFTVGIGGGSFNAHQEQLGWQYSDSNVSSNLQFHHIASDGYREQTAMVRTGVNWQMSWRHKHTTWNSLLWYTYLQYQTPGGLTAAQMLDNPTAARPPAGAIPGAVQQKAGVTNQTIMGALHMQHVYNEKVQLKSFLQLSTTKFANPFITNYEVRNEKNINGGAQIIITPFAQRNGLQWITGFEYLINESGIQNYQNNGGNKDYMMSNDIVYSTQAFLFSQISTTLVKNFTINLGFSTNKQVYEYKRLSDINPSFQNRSIEAPFVPRFSANYAITRNLHVYGVIAKGFSVPSLAEVRPSDGNFYPFLQAEQGWNYELGIKGTLYEDKVLFDINAYRFLLQQAIVRKTDAAGAEYFVNAGTVLQQGIEATVKWKLKNTINIFSSFTYQPYTFQAYSSGNNRYDGNAVTGVPGTIWVSGADWQLPRQFLLQSSINATSTIPLNDANTTYAKAYQLVQAKLSKTITAAKRKFICYVAADNLLNQSYSLGNDINAVGARFFNPSPTRNFYAGIHITFNQ